MSSNKGKQPKMATFSVPPGLPPPARSTGAVEPTKAVKDFTSKPRAPGRHFNRAGCRTSEYRPPGSLKVGLTTDNQPSKIVHEVHFGVPKGAQAVLQERFPGVAVVSVGAQSHDHPIANISRRLVWDHSVIGKLAPGSRVLDVYGDPNYNEHFNARQGTRNPITIDTMCHVMTAKDAIRRHRWGPQYKMVGDERKARWIDAPHDELYRQDGATDRNAVYDTFIMNHAVYYLPLDEICRIVNIRPDTPERPGPTLVATLHRFGVKGPDGKWDWQARSGTLNGGEQTWTRATDGTITQTNVLTGESYTHPDVERFFRGMQYAERDYGMAWTVTLGCDDHYVITFAQCKPSLITDRSWWKDNKIVGRAVCIDRGEANPRPQVIYSELESDSPVSLPPRYEDVMVEVDASKFFGNIHAGQLATAKIKVHVKPEHMGLLNKLESFMVMKPRNMSTLKDLTSKAQRESGQSVLVGGTGKRLDISARELSEIIMLAFLRNVEHEQVLLGASVTSSTTHLNSLLAGKHRAPGTPVGFIREGLRLAIGVNAVASTKATGQVHAALALIDEWF